MPRLLSLCLLLAVLAGSSRPDSVQAQTTVASATLTVIGGAVSVQPRGGSIFLAATDGQAVGSGSRVRTACDGRAALTLFDGSTVALDPCSELLVERLTVPSEPSSDGPLASVRLEAGSLWANVVALFGREGGLEVRAGDASALSREGGFGCRLASGDLLTCWRGSGGALLLRQDEAELTLAAGEQASASPAGGLRAAGPHPEALDALEVRAGGVVLPRLVTPEGLTVGFPLGELVVNQVPDARTSAPTAPDRWLRLPGPTTGAYALVLQPEANGPYVLRVALESSGREVAAYDWTGEARFGEVLVVDLDVLARRGVPMDLVATAPRAQAGVLPGNFAFP